MRNRTVFLDRDGVINGRRADYVKSWEEFDLLPGALDAMARITSSGRQLVVMTNQSAIARRLISIDTVNDIHERVAALVAGRGGRISAFLVCPHAPEDGCDCRKPAPGLFFRARQELHIDLADAVMVGDQASDVQAARAAGCEAILVDPQGTKFSEGLNCIVVASLAEAAMVICAD